MFQPHTISSPDENLSPKGPPLVKRIKPDSDSDFKYGLNSHSGIKEAAQTPQNLPVSFVTPGSNGTKTPSVLDDITNLMLNVNPRKLDFSASNETNGSRNQTPNYIMKKFDTQNLDKVQDRENLEHFNKISKMEIENSDLVINLISSEKSDSTKNDYEFPVIKDLTKAKSKFSLSKAAQKEDPKPPASENHTLIKRWKKSDKIFEGKFSTGTTPKLTSRETAKNSMPLSLIPLKRHNTDVPPTFESEQLMILDQHSQIGVNKYIENFSQSNDPMAGLFNTEVKAPINLNMVTQVKPKLLRDFPLDLVKNNSSSGKTRSAGLSNGLFLIPERARETENLPTVDSKTLQNLRNELQVQSKGRQLSQKEQADLVSKLLNFDEQEEEKQEKYSDSSKFLGQTPDENSMKEDSQEIGTPSLKAPFLQKQDSLFAEVREECQTPPTRNGQFEEEKFNFFNTVTARKEAHSKLFDNSADFEDVRPFNTFSRGVSEEEDYKKAGGTSGKFNKPEQPSSRFDTDYEVLEVLGSGYFGTVYKCQKKLDGLIYAIKCTKNKFKGQNNLNQALNEAQALASLCALDENPFIVRYYSAWIEDDRLYLAMEHCQSNLKVLRQQHIKFSESMIRQIMRDICTGLRHLHNQKIVHLDIKPENILYSKTKKYKIADLGLSRIAQRSNHEDINEGDCRYLAPELLKDFPDNQIPDLTKADIFSFGATIYELMIGNDLPKNGVEWTDLRGGNLFKLNQLNYSNSLKSMLRSMMNNDPAKRPSAHELLTNFLQSEIELELKWEKKQNKILKDKIKDLEKMLQTKRKNSI